MSKEQNKDLDCLPSFHLTEAYPDAKSIFTVSLPPLEAIRDESLVVLDTNVLLIPYTINPKSLNEIKTTYARLIDEGRLFIPAQVAREFARNRSNKIGELFQQFSRKRNKLDSLQVGRYPLLEPVAEYAEVLQLEKEIDEKLKQYKKAIGKVLDHIRSWRWNDSVSSLYSELFQPAVITDSPLSSSDIEIDLERRNTNRIPPGFKDSSKDDKGVGDLLIWQTILHLGREYKKSIIFISGEEKADWWHRSEGEALYPRFELVDEFRQVSEGKSFHIAKFSQLLDLFGAEEQVVEEVRKEEFFRKRIYSTKETVQEGLLSEMAVDAWLRLRFPDAEQVSVSRFPDFIVQLSDGQQLGVEVKVFKNTPPQMIWHRIRDVAFRGYYEVNEGRLSDFGVAIVLNSEEMAKNALLSFERVSHNLPQTKIIIGYVNSEVEFSPVFENLDNIC